MESTFHATTILAVRRDDRAVLAGDGGEQALLTLADARGQTLAPAGAVSGRVSGSFVHLIDLA